MRLDTRSIQAKILVALALVITTLMVATTWHMAVSERAMAQSLAEQKAFDTASSYFDGVNTMTLMEQSSLFDMQVVGVVEIHGSFDESDIETFQAPVSDDALF